MELIGYKIKVETHFGNKLCVIDKVENGKVHFKNKKFGLEVDKTSIKVLRTPWRGAKYIYISFN